MQQFSGSREAPFLVFDDAEKLQRIEMLRNGRQHLPEICLGRCRLPLLKQGNSLIQNELQIARQCRVPGRVSGLAGFSLAQESTLVCDDRSIRMKCRLL